MKNHFPDEVIKQLCQKIKKFSPEEIYKFDFSNEIIIELNNILGEVALTLESLEKTPYERTCAVRALLEDAKWWADRGQVEKLARWIATSWGRVDRKASDNSKLNALIDRVNSNNFDMERIATWSKYIAFRYPKERAIFDARTVFSLNWFIYESGGQKFFPFLAGENTLLSALDYQLWLATKVLGSDSIRASLKNEIDDNFKKSRTVSQSVKKITIDQSYAYEIYCDLLKCIANEIYPSDAWGLTKVEMILFSIASTSVALSVYTTMIANHN